jgi:surface antigen
MQTQLQGCLKRFVTDMPRRTAVIFVALIASLAGLGLCSVTAARADGIVLCQGYADCSVGNFTTNGYESAAATSWWQMYPGVNCTNYAAYVESQIFGVAKPGYLLGDAGQWAANAAAHGVTVDGVPSIGSVAVWDSGAPGMGGYGHVGIVEAIGPDGDYIDVSQSGMGTSSNGYNWEQIYPGTRSGSWEPWPSSFIHFPGTRVPSSPGTPTVGVGLWISGTQVAAAGTQ